MKTWPQKILNACNGRKIKQLIKFDCKMSLVIVNNVLWQISLIKTALASNEMCKCKNAYSSKN
jgi:hypothetical protein